MTVEKTYRGPCPCGSLLSYALCCQKLHNGEPAADAEALMRSRYTAFGLKLQDYLLATWHASTLPTDLDVEASARRWLGLKVMRHEVTGPDTADVEFTARYKAKGRAWEIHETSHFVREDGRWFYVDGDFEKQP
ncbi:hypothetical protein KKP04_10790 [Rhodomicrobium sp. Az07]|uniref:YchJ family protein n=1 Tax=Rhodomicrobium sp. Az07 TaxID=2839034 RepID=UPI001BED1883|nr:YchJ family metal-binding protein [Rhodomicrobium sp. Az07]MBT3071349.1 hypothetical protein [Rhodomicrobium sp. Az07]